MSDPDAAWADGRKILVTAALPYANGPLHLGHMVEYIQADVWVRYQRLRGRNVLFVCADDTHGTPIMIRARKEGTPPEELIERMWHEHLRDFDRFRIGLDCFYTTHSPENRELSEEIYRALQAGGHLEVREIEQAYCPEDQMFLPDRFIKGNCPNCGSPDQYGDACEVCSKTYDARDLKEPYCAQCGTTPEWRSSEHVFFRLRDFEEPLREWVEGGGVQEQVANKLREWFEAGLQDWDISRDAPYFGFEIPDRPGKYFYVWLDAPVGYMAATRKWAADSGGDFDSYWRREEESRVVHFIGKDIIYFHALFWPATLLGSGFRKPTSVFAHGFLTVGGEKMSKARGTFINAATYLEHLDPQYLRYYYATKLNSRLEDLDLNFEDFVSRVDADLVNKIANIPSRSLSILHKRCGGRLTRMEADGREMVERLRVRAEEVGRLYDGREYAQVTRALSEMAGEVNVFFQDKEPWAVAKEDPESAAAVITAALNGYRVIATLLQPILPDFGATSARMLGLETLTWEGLDELLEERPVGRYERLVERVEREGIEAVLEASRESAAAPGAAPEGDSAG